MLPGVRFFYDDTGDTRKAEKFHAVTLMRRIVPLGNGVGVGYCFARKSIPSGGYLADMLE